MRVEHAVGADHGVGADHDVGMNDGAGADAGAARRSRRTAPMRTRVGSTHRVRRRPTASGCTPGCGPTVGRQQPAPRARTSGTGSALRMHRARRAGRRRAPTITALALVVASAAAYFGLARNVTSPGPAARSWPRGDLDAAVALERALQSPASSPSVTRSRISRGRSGHPLDEAWPAAAVRGGRPRRESRGGGPSASSANGAPQVGQRRRSARPSTRTSCSPRRAPRHARKWPTTVKVKK